MKHLNRLLASIAFCLPLCLSAQQSQDLYSTWFDLGFSKSLSKQFSLNFGAEVRTPEKPRAELSVGATYKPLKYLKVGVGYSFLDRYKAAKYEDHYKKDIVDPENWNGFDNSESYWRISHRANVDVTGTFKLWKWLRISVRERYQYSYVTACDFDEYKERYERVQYYDGEKYITEFEMKDGYPRTEVKHKESADDHVLRSRLKLEVDKKKWKVSPFVSAEAHNSLSNSMTLEKIRASAGAEVKFSKCFSLTAAYVLNAELYDDGEMKATDIHERVHAFSLGCNFDF